MKKKTVIILSVVLAIAFISGVLYLSLRDKDANSPKDNDTSSITSSEVLLEEPENEKDPTDVLD